MATIITRASKGSALTWTEGDQNLTNLNTAKIELTDLSASSSGAGSLSYNNTTGVITYTGPDLSGYQLTSQKGAANGYASLDSAGLVPSTQLPSYVDDVLEYANTGAFPATGESGKIYVAVDTSKCYRWSGSTYVEISASPGTTDSLTEGTTNLYFTTARARSSFSNGTGITITNGVIATTITQGITDVVQDTTPQLGGDLDVNAKSIVSASNGNIAITPNGTGQTIVKNLEYNENIFSLGTTSGTITPNAANGNVQTITLNGNLTFSAFASPVAGQSITLIVNTNGTGRTLTSTMKFAGGEKTLSTTSTTDIISVFYDGTTYWASLAKDFK